MLKIIKRFFCLLYIRALMLYYSFTKPIAPQIAIDPVAVYIDSKKRKLVASYDLITDFNANLDTAFYDSDAYKKKLRDESNDIERLWKTRILHESTPKGAVFMYYDVYKQGFAYYADQNIPYNVLNAIAMKYVMTYFCRDFFFDEDTITIERRSKLVKTYNEEDKKNGATNTHQTAKFKQYKSKNNSNEKENDKPPELLKNKFISLGKIHNLYVLSKKPGCRSANQTSFDGMFGKKISYKDFKNKI